MTSHSVAFVVLSTIIDGELVIDNVIDSIAINKIVLNYYNYKYKDSPPP